MPRAKGDGGPAFPITKTEYVNTGRSVYKEKIEVTYDGMTLRDYAVIKFLSSQIQYEGMEGSNVKLNVAMAHEYFDTMLEAREAPDA